MTANGPAYPVKSAAELQYHGLTKRELIAAMAMQGLASVPFDGSSSWKSLPKEDAERAVAYADALLAELAKEPQA
jgi:hypothetical protein